jgi:hypothetical protein
MTEEEIRMRALAMPLTNPAYPPGPYRFVGREYVIITYRTDPERLRAIVPEPLALDAPLVKYEFIRIRRRAFSAPRRRFLRNRGDLLTLRRPPGRGIDGRRYGPMPMAPRPLQPAHWRSDRSAGLQSGVVLAHRTT